MREAEAAFVSSGTTVALSQSKTNFPLAVRQPNRLPHLSHFFFLNPFTSSPTQWVGNGPTCPQVEDSPLKRRPHTFTRKYQLAYSFSLHGTHPHCHWSH